jgi:hypothetical protein
LAAELVACEVLVLKALEILDIVLSRYLFRRNKITNVKMPAQKCWHRSLEIKAIPTPKDTSGPILAERSEAYIPGA